ncbi:hypothetical protein J7E96_19560 [Streptomyces sp. ISL-96]|uniref:hypothetical protein n=1 Tax=Streptomyces sp. ISL-96 TaxID=2819191 RepID=UPI001BEC80A3|nr:hypothetical protein [Streptomyces sp. ISL-96]MBT2490672.1 hypothetical protein [Streptomyces sp. ISL-96]
MDAFKADGAEPRPAQYVAVSISAFGFRAQADGHTGWAALRRIRRSHPALAWAAVAQVAVLTALVAALCVAVWLR